MSAPARTPAGRASAGRTSTGTSTRESLLSRAIFRFYPELSTTPVLFDPLDPAGDRHLALGVHRPCLEGGDVLVLSPDVIAVFSTDQSAIMTTKLSS